MNLTLTALVLGIITIISVEVFYFLVLRSMAEKIAIGSGSPISISRIFLSSLYSSSQIIFGIIFTVILAMLMSENFIPSEAGLPVLSAVVVYILGKERKDILERSLQSKEKKI